MLQAHHLSLNTLTGVDISGARCASECAGDGDDLIANAARGLKDQFATDTTYALNADIHDVRELNHAEHAVGPGFDLDLGHVNGSNNTQSIRAVNRLSRVSAQQVLNGRGQPHSVNQRSCKAGKTCSSVGGVDWVEVSGNNGEGRHVFGSLNAHVTQEGTRRIRVGICDLRCRCGRLGRGDAASDSETLNQAGENCAFSAQLKFDAHHAAGRRLSELSAASHDLDAGSVSGKRGIEEDRVVQVNGIDQTFNDRDSLVHCRAQCGVNCGPAGANKSIGNSRGELRRQCATGHRAVSVAQVLGESEGITNRAKTFAGDDSGHLLNVVAIHGRRAHTSGAGKQIVSGHGQSRHVNNRVSAGHARAGEKNGDVDVLN